MYWIDSSDGLDPESVGWHITQMIRRSRADRCGPGESLLQGLFEPQPCGWLSIDDPSQALQGANDQ